MEIFANYSLLQKIGEGGMGEVFLAKNQKIAKDNYCVIKRLLPKFAKDRNYLEMFLDEMQLLKTLKHPNLVNAYECSYQQKIPYIAMEYVAGITLAELISKEEFFKQDYYHLRLFILTEILAGLSYLHSPFSDSKVSILHRDLAPENILISWQGEVKITDFGLSKAIEDEYRTQSSLIKGHFHYLSPEQALAEELSSKSDIFSFSLIAYELLLGKKLFEGKVWHHVLKKIIESEPGEQQSFGKTLPAKLKDSLRICLKRDPQQRIISTDKLLTTYRSLLPAAKAQSYAQQLAQILTKLFPQQRQGQAKQSLSDDSYLSLSLPFWQIDSQSEQINRAEKTAEKSLVKEEKKAAWLNEPSGLKLANPTSKKDLTAKDLFDDSFKDRFQRYQKGLKSDPWNVESRIVRMVEFNKKRASKKLLLSLLLSFICLSLVILLLLQLKGKNQQKLTAKPLAIVEAELATAKKYGQVTIRGIPNDFSIYLNQKKEARGTPITLSHIEAGKKHKLSFYKKGYKPYIVELVLKPEENRRLFVKLKKE